MADDSHNDTGDDKMHDVWENRGDQKIKSKLGVMVTLNPST